MSLDEESFIQRCPHDVDHPFSIVSHSLIRDDDISPECCWLIIYLLSMKNDWKVSVKQIHKKKEKFWGRQKVYKLLNEAINAGYMCREVIKKGNLNAGFNYFLSENRRFKKENSNNFSDVPVSGIPSAGIPKSNTHKNNHRETNNISKKEREVAIASPPLQSEEKRDIPEIFEELSNLLLTKIRSHYPQFKQPNLKDWSKTLFKASKIDNRHPDDIRLVLDYIFEKSDFWTQNIQSAQSLRRNWDKIWAQMHPPKTQESQKHINRALAQKCRHVLSVASQGHLLMIYNTHIQRQNGETLSLDINPEDFRRTIFKWFNLESSNGRNQD